MKRLMKYILSLFLTVSISMSSIYGMCTYVSADDYSIMSENDINSKAAVVIEGSTGEILFEKNKDEELMLASVTKVMTLLLIFEELKSGKINLNDPVTVSEYAASMGGSQVYLEPGETQTVETMIKCISISSANDAAVAMAEHISGSEAAFVDKMNSKAKSLGMNHTHFINCNGLDDDITSGHYSSAYDIALMSKELVVNHPEISDYSTVWMDSFIHKNSKGVESEFGLTNTNKLIRSYNRITGLKTGSTSKAKYCLSATAKRDNINIISVILAAPDHKTRFSEAARLLDYGFSRCSSYTDNHSDFEQKTVKVRGSLTKEITCRPENEFVHIFTGGEDTSLIEKNISVNDTVSAPVKESDPVGKITYLYNGKEIGNVNLIAEKAAESATFPDYYKMLLSNYISLRYCL